MDEQKREFTGIWIPKHIVEDDRLSWLERALYAEISCFEDCFMSNAFFSRRLGISERRVQELISELRGYGYVVDTGFDGRRRHLQAVKAKELPPVNKSDFFEGVRGSHAESRTPAMRNLAGIDNNIENKETLAETKVSEEEYQEVDDILSEVDEEFAPTSSLRRRKGPAPSEPLLEWASRKTGRKFAVPIKQRTAILALKRAGYDDEDIKTFWMDLEVDPYWATKGIDFTIILSQIDKMSNRVDLTKLKKQFDDRVKEMNRMVAGGAEHDEVKKFIDEFVRPMRDKYGFR